MIYRCLVFVCQFLWGSICGQTRLKAPGPTTGGSEFEEAAWPSQAHPSQSTETLVNGIVGIVFVATFVACGDGSISIIPFLRMNILKARYCAVKTHSACGPCGPICCGEPKNSAATPQNCSCQFGFHVFIIFLTVFFGSMDWFKGKSTGNHRFSH